LLIAMLAGACGPPVGTNPGSMLIDLVPGPNNSNPTAFRRVGSRVYFATFGVRQGTWRSDGSSEGTVQVSDQPLQVVDAGDGDAWGVDISGIGGVFWIPEGGEAELISELGNTIAAIGGRAVVAELGGLHVLGADGSDTMLIEGGNGAWSFARARNTIFACNDYSDSAMVIELDPPAIWTIEGSQRCTMVGAIDSVALAMVAPNTLQRVTRSGVRTLVSNVCCGVTVTDDAAYMLTGFGNDLWSTDGNVATQMADDASGFQVLGAFEGRVVLSAAPDQTVAYGPEGREVLSPSQSWFSIPTPRGLWYWDGLGRRWVTDGTKDGTREVAQIAGMSTSEVAILRDTMFYTGFDGHGAEPWVAEMGAADVQPLPDAGAL
jgi:hypothetical protein